MPEDSATQEVQCAKCGAKNPRDATACQSCGAGLLATGQEQQRVPLVPRLLVSLVVGLLVLILSTYLAFGQFCASAIRYPQSLTLERIGRLGEAIEAYRQEKHILPKSLRDLPEEAVVVDETGAPVDWWHRALEYWTDGTHYRITSYGYDGKPGGLGLDYDVSSDDLDEDEGSQAMRRWAGLPRETTPTFRQFASDRGLIRTVASHMHGSGRMMLVTSILAGVVAFILAFRTMGATAPVGRNTVFLVLRLVVTVAATLFIGMMIAVFHVPSGH